MLNCARLFVNPCTIHSPWNFLGQNTGVKEKPFPSPGDHSNPGSQPRYPELQVDYLPAEPSGYTIAEDVICIWIKFTHSCPVSLVAQMVKHLLAMWETLVQSLEKEMASHSSILPGKLHGWRILVGYSPWGHYELDKTEWIHFTSLLPCSLVHWFLRCLCSVSPSLSWQCPIYLDLWT